MHNHGIRCGFRRGLIVALLAAVTYAPKVWANGTAAPDCAWTLQNGKQISSVNQLRGKVVYVDFWASWCAPCALSFPFMNDLQSADASKGLQIVAVNMDEKPADAQRFLAAHPARFDVAVGANAACAKAFGVTDMPSSFVINRNGVIRLTHRGFRRDDPDVLRPQVETLLKE